MNLNTLNNKNMSNTFKKVTEYEYICACIKISKVLNEE